MSTNPNDDKKVTSLGGYIFLAAFLFGVTGIIFYSFSVSASLRPTIIGISLLLSGGSFFMGVLLGFLFGIPRALQSSDENKDSSSYRVNTNLEQISDWLTKILVGVGLTQINKIPTALKNLAEALTPVLGGVPNSGVYGVMVVLYYVITGFLYSYLVTRIYIGKIFRIADQSALEAVVKKLAKQPDLDAHALDITNQYLTSSDASVLADSELKQIIGKASPSARYAIFSQTMKCRHENWRINKKMMERVIPLFKALSETDTPPINHQYYGQLGYALKDKEIPEWKDALTNLDRAIEIRGEKSRGFRFYEFNRAICRIVLSESTGSNENNKIQIIHDLKEAGRELNVSSICSTEEILSNWVKKNNVQI